MCALGGRLRGLSALNGGLSLGCVLDFRGGVGADQTVFSVADQVASARFTKRGDDDLSVFGAEILEKSSLLRFFFFRFGDENRFFRVGVQSRVEHASGDRSGCRIEVLDLLGVQAFLFQKQRKVNRVHWGTTRVGGHKVRHQILFFARRLGQFVKAFFEAVIHRNAGFPHLAKHVIRRVFGGNF